MKNSKILSIALILLLGSVACKPQQKASAKATPQAARLMTQMDQNQDGSLSRSEVQGPLANDFDKVDTDENGLISLVELSNAPGPQRQGGGNRPAGGPPR